jgi:preprotein translocase subunit YajC
MKDVKVDVRVNVGVDTASVVLLLASAAMAVFLYKQNKQERQERQEKQEAQERLKSNGA